MFRYHEPLKDSSTNIRWFPFILKTSIEESPNYILSPLGGRNNLGLESELNDLYFKGPSIPHELGALEEKDETEILGIVVDRRVPPSERFPEAAILMTDLARASICFSTCWLLITS